MPRLKIFFIKFQVRFPEVAIKTIGSPNTTQKDARISSFEFGEYLKFTTIKTEWPSKVKSMLYLSNSGRENSLVRGVTQEDVLIVSSSDSISLMNLSNFKSKRLAICAPTGSPAVLGDGLALYNEDLYFCETQSPEVMVLALECSIDHTEETPTFRASRLCDKGWSRSISGKQSGLTPAGSTNQLFALVGSPPCLLLSSNESEVEVHALSMGSRAKISVALEKIICADQLDLSGDSWCLALMATNGRSVLIRGKEDDLKETLKVDKTVFDTGLGAWDQDELVLEDEEIVFDSMCTVKSQKRLVLAARKVLLVQ